MTNAKTLRIASGTARFCTILFVSSAIGICQAQASNELTVRHVTDDGASSIIVGDNGVTASTDSRQRSHVPGQLIVKYRDSVTESVEHIVLAGKSFRSVTTGNGDSLDHLHRKYQVRSATRAFAMGIPANAIDRATQKRNFADKLRAVKKKFSRRTARAPGNRTIPDLTHIYVLTLPSTFDVESAAKEFSRDPHVVYAQPNYYAKVNFVPNDTYYDSTGSWGQAEDDLWGLKRIQMETAWDISQGAGTVIGVVDTGVDYNHKDIAANVVSGWDFAENDSDPMDDHGHGTHVSGTIAAIGNNNTGIIGVAPQAKIMPLKAFDAEGVSFSEIVADAIVFGAMNGADILNNSWGCSGRCPSNPLAEEAVRTAYALGTVLVFSAGNASDDVAFFSPQNMVETITVAASTPGDTPAFFSNFGSWIDVTAPGGGEDIPPPAFDPNRNILSLKSKAAQCDSSLCPTELLVDRKYLRQSGTSMSAPHVAGLAGLILSKHPEFNSEQVRQAIRKGSDDVDAPNFDYTSGYGRINATNAVALDSPMTALITQPTNSAVTGATSVSIEGVAAGQNFGLWRLDYGIGENPSSWTTINSSTSAVEPAGFLASWDITSVPDDQYTLRLIVEDSAGNLFQDRRAIVIDQLVITDPPPVEYRLPPDPTNTFSSSTFFRGGDIISLHGTVAPANLASFSVKAEAIDGAVVDDGVITVSNNGSQPVIDGLIATWDTTNVPADHYRLVLEATLANGEIMTDSTQVGVDPTLHAGWPKHLGFIVGEPALGHSPESHIIAADIDGDGIDELVVGYLHSVNVFDDLGNNLPGWPQAINPASREVPWSITDSPIVSDLTGDGSPEVIALNRGGEHAELYVWDAAGNLLPGWPIAPDPSISGSLGLSSDDINNDGINEIIVSSPKGVIHVVDDTGQALPGWPRTLAARHSPLLVISNPSTADMDNDGNNEIAVVTMRELFLLDSTGNLLPSWPQTIFAEGSGNVHPTSPPIFGDIDGDGELEVVAGAWDGTIYAFNRDGTEVSGWPRALTIERLHPSAAGDINGDGTVEIVIGNNPSPSRQHTLHALDGDGSYLPGWPVNLPGSLFVYRGIGFQAPALADITGDGMPNILVSSDVTYDRPFAFHAFHSDGATVAGFPKPTTNTGSYWTNSPAIADIDGDGLLEIAWIDLSSNLFVWDTDSPASGPRPWPMAGQNAAQTGAAAGTSVPPVECTVVNPSIGVTSEGGGQGPATNASLVATFTGHITDTGPLLQGKGDTVTLCPATTVDYVATTTVGTASCTVNGVAQSAAGTLAIGDSLVCTNKPGGKDTDSFTVVADPNY